MSLTKYLSLFVRKYRQTYPHLCTRLRQRPRRTLHFNLNLDLYSDLNFNLNLGLIPQSYQSLLRQSFATLLGSMFVSRDVQL